MSSIFVTAILLPRLINVAFDTIMNDLRFVAIFANFIHTIKLPKTLKRPTAFSNNNNKQKSKRI